MYNNNYYQPPRNLGMQANQMYQQPVYQPIYQPVTMQSPVSQQIPNGLQGKSVDSIDVVKAMDIPLDGSISYFPLTDGSAIVTKQLQVDGTSKTTIYKPSNGVMMEQPKYATLDDIKKEINNINLSGIDELKEEIKELREEIKNATRKESKK